MADFAFLEFLNIDFTYNLSNRKIMFPHFAFVTNLATFWQLWVGNTEFFSAWVIGPFPVCHKTGSGGHILTLFTQTPSIHSLMLVFVVSSHERILCQVPKGFLLWKLENDAVKCDTINTQCRNFSIFLSLRFYVKPIFKILDALKMPFLQYWRLNVYFLLNFILQKMQKKS